MQDMSRVETAVILAGGLGTRMLPATKSVPKELLPLADRPIIQYAIEECAASGIGHVVIVISEGKESIREHFAPGGYAASSLREQGRDELADLCDAAGNLAEVEFAYQHEAKGIAHALKQAQPLIRGEALAVFYPDDVILGDEPCIGQLADAYERRPGTVLAVEEVPTEEVSNYGIVAPSGEGDPIPLRGVVEKPPRDEAPSRLAIVGRLVLPKTIFGHIDNLQPGKGGELQLTDAIALQLAAGEPVSAYRFRGERHDTGRPPGYIAANVAAALRNPAYRDRTLELLGPLVEGAK